MSSALGAVPNVFGETPAQGSRATYQGNSLAALNGFGKGAIGLTHTLMTAPGKKAGIARAHVQGTGLLLDSEVLANLETLGRS